MPDQTNAGAPAATPSDPAPAGDPVEAPFGAWESPIAVDRLVEGIVRLGAPVFDGDDILWGEGRPKDAGHQAVVRRTPDGTVRDVTPAGVNVRSRVHEYGGGAWTAEGGDVVYSNFADGRISFVPAAGGAPLPLTPEGPFRFADLRVDRGRGRVLAVREDHTGPGEATNTIVAFPLDGSRVVTTLFEGTDFVSSPRLSPDGSRLAWLTWNHPNMPWDGSILWQAAVKADGSLATPELVAGSAAEWTSQPLWSPSGVLHFANERTGWMQLYRRVDGRDEPVTPVVAEFAYPDWVFNLTNYGFAADGTVVAIGRSGGQDRLYAFAPDGSWRQFDLPYTELGSIAVRGNRALLQVSGPMDFTSLIEVDVATGRSNVFRVSVERGIDFRDVSAADPVDFPTTDGEIAHGLFYPPRNRRFRGPAGELPPLLVTSHGGPTAAASSDLSIRTQLFTSRGFAVLDVDYGGSTGYGRDYRKRLEGNWGVVDVDDCVHGALALAGRGLVDRDRVAIEGGSASGYTTLAALAFRDVFRAGVSMFGIGDLAALESDTHKFESRYTWSLVAPFEGNEELYRERSPAFHVDDISCPVLILQGLDDRVVPPAQAEQMAAALAANGIPHAAIYFEGEDHGFRKAENIIRSFEAELSFFGQVFGFTPADDIEPVELVR
jgi:dipeptidyl aminopeptidase/acylaminoacyl peptidase